MNNSARVATRGRLSGFPLNTEARGRSGEKKPPIKTNPASDDCSFRKSQTRLVSRGSTRKTLLNIGQNASDRFLGAARLVRRLLQQFGPFFLEALGTELDRNRKKPIEAGTQERGTNPHGIRSIGVGPHQPRMLLPKLLICFGHDSQNNCEPSPRQCRIARQKKPVKGAGVNRLNWTEC